MKKSVFLLLLLMPITSFAHHLNGGYISLKWLSSNKYELSVKLVREFGYSYGADLVITIGVFQKGTDSLKQQIKLDLKKFTSDTLSLPKNCQTYDPKHIVENYVKEISFDTSIMNHLNTYYLSYQRCCRPSGFANIALSGDMGMCLYAEIPAPGFVKNSSPTLAKFPYLAAVLNKPFQYSLAFADVDQDSIRYSLVTPLKGVFTKDNPTSASAFPGPYTEVPYNPNYSLANMLGVAPQNRLKIDSITGLLSAVPEREGKYSIGVLVEEFRAGVKIGETRLDLVMFVFKNWTRDLRLSVVNEIGSAITDDTLYVTNHDSLFLGAYAQLNLDSTFIKFEFPYESLDTFTNKPNFIPKKGDWRRVYSNFYWKGNCEFNRGESPIVLRVTATDNGCLVPNSVSRTFFIKTSKSLEITGPSQVCAGDNLVRYSLPESLSSNTYTWLLPDWMKGQSTSNSILVNFEPSTFRIGTIQVTGNNGCNEVTSSFHSVMATNKPDAPIINYTGLNIHSNVPIGNSWFRDGLLLFGEVDDFLTARNNGIYTCVLNYYGCKSDPSNEITLNTSLGEHTNQDDWLVFPNPFTSELNINLPANWSSAEYVLSNSMGQIVQEGTITLSQTISTESLNPGMYIIQIKSPKGRLLLKKIMNYEL